MKAKHFIVILFVASFSQAQASEACVCKCVSKDNEGQFSTVQGKGADREEAGIDLKKNLLGGKCEISPSCSGRCSLDEVTK